MIENLSSQLSTLKEYVNSEVELAEEIQEKLQNKIDDRDKVIADLKETLSVPRQHFKYIERLTDEQVKEQKQ